MKRKIACILPILFLLVHLAGCKGDSSGSNSSPADTDTAPTLNITGNSSVSVRLGETYTDAGAVAFDEEDGDLTLSIVTTSNVDTSTAGVYQVRYSVTDSDGNSTEAIRMVQVTLGTMVPRPNAHGSNTMV